MPCRSPKIGHYICIYRLYVMFGFSGSSELCLRKQTDRTTRSCIIIYPRSKHQIRIKSQHHKYLRSLKKNKQQGLIRAKELEPFPIRFQLQSCRMGDAALLIFDLSERHHVWTQMFRHRDNVCFLFV